MIAMHEDSRVRPVKSREAAFLVLLCPSLSYAGWEPSSGGSRETGLGGEGYLSGLVPVRDAVAVAADKPHAAVLGDDDRQNVG